MNKNRHFCRFPHDAALPSKQEVKSLFYRMRQRNGPRIPRNVNEAAQYAANLEFYVREEEFFR